MKYADLHVHTSYSDSTFSPEEVISRAREIGLDAIAISDHDCVDGIEPCMELGLAAGIEVIPAVELEVDKDGTEVHILGYFIDWKNEPFRKRLKEMQAAREGRMLRMIEKLKEHGIDIDPDEVFSLSGRGSTGRPHLAQVMLKNGKIGNIREAFNKYIGSSSPCFVPNIRFTPREAMETILRIGGVPVVAHPHIMVKDEYIEEFIGYGLKGIEVYHSDHNPRVTRRYKDFAARHGLLITGGSDCHGLGKKIILMGTVKVPYKLVEDLKAEAKKIRDEYR